MNNLRGKRVAGLLVVIALVWSLGPAPPAQAGSGETDLAIGAAVLGVIAVPAIAYAIWVNRPSQQGKERLIPGEFYVGGFIGGSIPRSHNWTIHNTTVGDLSIRHGVVGGLKFGYFCHWFPYAGAELETNFTRNDIRGQNVTLTPPVAGSTVGSVAAQRLYIWTPMALRLLLRYGFLKDQEVPFGRLQPYVGVGPGFVVIYGERDSAKNFSLEASAGVRYMLLKNVSAFAEYQFSYQWNAELESQNFFVKGVAMPRGTATFDYETHRVVAGVTYHF